MVWSRVIGQESVKNLLLGAMHAGRLPHAYLFVGNEGVGKDAMAIEFARVLHCEKGGDEPCNACDSCAKSLTLQHPDIRLVTALPVGKGEKSDDPPLDKLNATEIQAVQEQYRQKAGNPYHRIAIPKATVIKINSIRDIRRESAMSTYGRKKRVIIISRADEMGDAAANTLLKTLEEPSSNTMLILTTAHRSALLPTILSRCQVVQFHPLHEEDIAQALRERNGVEKEQAEIVARLANGSYTKACELMSDDVAEQRRQVMDFVRTILRTDVVAITDAVDELCSTKDRDVLVRFLQLLLIWFRDVLVLGRGGAVINMDQLDDLRRFVNKFPAADVHAILAAIERAVSLVERNVYINVVMLQLIAQLRTHIVQIQASRSSEPSAPSLYQ
jgi:DNA polymerase III subunit delta'